jgi:hypothetical protein
MSSRVTRAARVRSVTNGHCTRGGSVQLCQLRRNRRELGEENGHVAHDDPKLRQ